MYYVGMCHSPRKAFHTWKAWAWWLITTPSRTYFSDIEMRFFLRLCGLEFKIQYWLPRDKRAYEVCRPGDVHRIDQSGMHYIGNIYNLGK